MTNSELVEQELRTQDNQSIREKIGRLENKKDDCKSKAETRRLDIVIAELQSRLRTTK